MQGNGRKIQRCSSRKIKYKVMSGEEMAAHSGEKTSMMPEALALGILIL